MISSVLISRVPCSRFLSTLSICRRAPPGAAHDFGYSPTASDIRPCPINTCSSMDERMIRSLLARRTLRIEPKGVAFLTGAIDPLPAPTAHRESGRASLLP
jgi:hypothetical protein